MVTSDKSNTYNSINEVGVESPNNCDSTLCVGNTNSVSNSTIPSPIIASVSYCGYQEAGTIKAGFSDCKCLRYLITQGELNQYKESEGKPIRIINKNPNFWTEARLIAEEQKIL